jgi:hypothetical protein
MLIRLTLFFIFCGFLPAVEPPVSAPLIRVERRPVPGGGELHTFFSGSSGGAPEIPLISILKDTLGSSDPAHDRLRQVWVFGYSPLSVLQRVAAGVPFLYRRAGWRFAGRGAPPPVLDVAKPGRGTWRRVLARVLQPVFLDPLGIPLRATTRAYRGRTDEYRLMHTWQALDVVSESPAPVAEDGFSREELEFLQGRLLLSTKMLGGLVDDRYVQSAWRMQQTRLAEMRSHNWELLRQSAEENGLYFQPLQFGGTQPRFVLLWIAQDAAAAAGRGFNTRFLGISDPFGDTRLQDWKGYSEIWFLDPDGAAVDGAAPGARPVKMIPLALYGLEHPRAPLLLADFRNTAGPRRHEMLRRFSDDVSAGLLGLTGIGNWPFLMAKSSLFFVQGRHGTAVHRQARLRAYIQLRKALLVDRSLAPRLRDEITSCVEALAMNPLEERLQEESRIALAQYSALLRAVDSGRLAEDLNRARGAEMSRENHSAAARAGLESLRIASFGLYRHKERFDLSDMDRQRRFAWHRRRLQSLLAEGLQPEVASDLEAVQTSIRALADLGRECRLCREPAAEILAQFLLLSSNERLREECIGSLQRLALAAGRPAAETFAGGED